MKTITFIISIILLISTACFAQLGELDVYIQDQETGIAIEDVHVFVVNSTFGATTESDGNATFQYGVQLQEDLIISHISYASKVIPFDEWKAWTRGQVITLTANATLIPEVAFTAKRTNEWQKNVDSFTKALLGTTKASKKCKIINPEVLRFEKTGNELRATSIDALQIKNDYLGYELNFFLKELVIEENGSTRYQGNSKYVNNFEEKNEKKIQKNREAVYRNSVRHFLRSLIKQQSKSDGYKLSISRYRDGQFLDLYKPEDQSLIRYNEEGKVYKLGFDEFLEVTNLKVSKVSEKRVGSVSGLESQKFSGTRDGKSMTVSHAVSQLYKIVDSLLVDGYGNILNNEHVREYGFWAEQRLADQLPFDYLPKGEKVIGMQQEEIIQNPIGLENFKNLLYGDQKTKQIVLLELDEHWSESYVPLLLELMGMTGDKWLYNASANLISKKMKEDILGYHEGLQWLWSTDIAYPEYYGDFKAEIYQNIDPIFKKYFEGRQEKSAIKLDEVLWGGVKQDGIPPLRYPKYLEVKDADYLKDKDVVFGFYINGVARAYPKRILAWHEFFVDEFDGIEIAGVYCTLCGTVIPYETSYNDVDHALGTSGFLYRSNKLMYDKATQSLWNTINGEPVIGPLVGQGIKLKTHPVVTTNWGEWKKRHPETKVLSLDTGHQRDYGEGVAYSRYFGTDELMFPVPLMENQLNNKSEVFVLRIEGYEKDPLAISVDHISRKGLIQDNQANKQIVFLGGKDKSVRAYDAGNIKFKSYKNGILLDTEDRKWTVREEYLILNEGKKLERLPGHQVFWFAWVNSFPSTRLIK